MSVFLSVNVRVAYFTSAKQMHILLFDSMEIGRWEKGEGVTMTKSKTRWYRRNDLQGAVVINSLSPFLCWASFTKDENGRVVGSEGYFQERHLQIAMVPGLYLIWH